MFLISFCAKKAGQNSKSGACFSLWPAVFPAMLLTALPSFTDAGGSSATASRFFYHGQKYGSEAGFNPLSSFINYSSDTLQMPLSFDSENMDERHREVWRNLTGPDEAINEDLGWGMFIHRQIIPIYPDKLWDSRDMLPNYTLHLIGGGNRGTASDQDKRARLMTFNKRRTGRD